MPITPEECREMQERLERNRRRTKAASSESTHDSPATPVELEIPLHRDILKWADQQWPPVPYIYSNPTKKTTIGKGIHDITLFISETKTLCVECKAREGKLRPDQRIWRKQMEMRGITVWEIRSFQQFLDVVEKQK